MPYNSLYKQKIEMGVELNWVIHGDKLKTLMTFLRLWVWYGRPDNLCLKRLLQYLVSKSHVLTTKRFFNRLTHVSSVNYVFRCYAYFQQWFWQFYEAIYDCFTLLREMFLKKTSNKFAAWSWVHQHIKRLFWNQGQKTYAQVLHQSHIMWSYCGRARYLFVF